MRNRQETSAEEKLYVASQWQLMWRKFTTHKLAIIGGIILAVFYSVAIFADFSSPYHIYKRYEEGVVAYLQI